MGKNNINTKKRVKVCHLIARMGTGGAEENTRYTIEGLDKNKYRIDLIVGNEFGEIYEKVFQEEKIKVIKISVFTGNLNLRYDTILFIRLISLFFKNKYDIIHTHGTKAGIIGRIAARITGIPIIVHGLHGNALDAFSSKWLNLLFLYFERLAGSFTDAHISVSTILSQNYIKHKIGRAEKYYTVRSGMDLSSFYQDGKSNFDDVKNIRIRLSIGIEDFVIANISRLEKLKGHALLLKALKVLKEQNKEKKIILLIVGDGEEKENILKYIKKHGLESNVFLMGYRNDIPDIMASANLLVHASFREGLPRVMVQAAAAGLPMVAFNVDGIPEVIIDGFNGFLVKPNDIDQLVKKIKIYLDKPELLNVHGNNSKKVIKNRWTIEGMVKGTDKIYSKLIEEKICRI